MIPLIKPDWPAPPGIRAFTTTRSGGCSQSPFDSFNLGARCGDEPRHVEENRDRFRAMLPSSPGWLNQVHGRRVVDRAEISDTDTDTDTDTDIDTDTEADAVVSFVPGQACTILTADCLPVLFCDRDGSRVAAAHAGWRGLAGGVLESTLAAMNTPAEEVMAWLGPAIGPDAFEVGPEVKEQFLSVYPQCEDAFPVQGDRLYADLYQIARGALAASGVASISGGELCTYTDQERFYSYRRDGRTGRMATVIWIE